MKAFSKELLDRLGAQAVAPSSARPRVLLTESEIQSVRDRAQATTGAVDQLAERAEKAARDPGLFGTEPDIPFLVRGALRPLADAALILEEERYAARALEGVEVMFSFPPEEWIARPHRPMRCDHAMLNVAASIGITLDLCAPFWSSEAIDSVSERVNQWVMPRFLETWEKQDAHWAKPDYHWNWKIMCCGEAGVAALACAEAVGDLDTVLQASLTGVLDILDCIPEEGDWPEGIGYWLGTLGYGLRFGLALRNATHGALDILQHPRLRAAGDYVVHVTEPDGGVYNFNDNPQRLGETLDYLSLLARAYGRGDWARTARVSEHITLEWLAWDDLALESETPGEGASARHFPWTGLATLRR